MSSHESIVVSVEPLELKDARWLTLKKIFYLDPTGAPRSWEAAQRTTRPRNSAIDAVHIVAHLRAPNGDPAILLQKQFRPPLGRICVEFPAGLVDEGESAEECAGRELREETGFVGSVREGERGKSTVLFGAPGMSSSCSLMIHMTIDTSLPENQNPKPILQDGEFIETFSVPIKDLYATLRKLEAEGCGIDGKVGAFAEGIAMAQSLN